MHERLADAVFIDRVIVRVTAGTGGSGTISFRREKFVPMGGPDGGDGGRGGDVIVRGDDNLATLLDYTYRDSWQAERGEHGSGSNKTGRSGDDVVLPVPPGTVIRDHETGELLGEVLEDGDEIVVARGGRGGKGNALFATSTHRRPREWQPGEDGEQRTLELELKLIADVGLVGQPNAGKSTLLSVISRRAPEDRRLSVHHARAEPRRRAAERQPHLRRRRHSGHHRGRARREGARAAVPAAHRAHARRSRSSSRSTPWTGRRSTTSCAARSRRIRAELAEKPHCVVFTKMDLLGEDERPPIEAPRPFGVFAISAAARTGLDELLAGWWRQLLGMRKAVERREGSVELP